MPSPSRPVKLACLACRASKIRCDGQKPCASCSIHRGECRYQPSRRGGARRGLKAAEELATKRAQRRVIEASTNNHGRNSDAPGQVFHPNSHDSASPSPAISCPPLMLPPIELSPRASCAPLASCCTGPPSPLGGNRDAQEPVGNANLSTWNIRAYRCDQDLINAYYVFIHPYLPFLPPPAVPQYEDKCITVTSHLTYANASTMPYWPTSPLGLAIASILVLIPPPEELLSTEDGAVTLRRSYADLYARSALESSEDSFELSTHVGSAKGSRSTLHPAVLRRMEPVLALGLISLYECCQRGDIPKMRIRANQALTIAMDLSLNTENPQTDCLDAHRRCWWTTVFLIYQSSIMSALPPIIAFDDLRITTIFPQFRGCREPWSLLARGQVALLRSCRIGRQLIREGDDNGVIHPSVAEEIQNLDAFIFELAAEADRFRCVTNYQGAEANASRNLWAISNALVHAARLTLHRVRAFPDRPIILDGYCDFLAIDAAQSTSQPALHFHLSPGRLAEIHALFPFTEQESLRICLHSALVISRVFRRLPSPNPMYSDAAEVDTAVNWAAPRPLASPGSIPYMACCQLQSFYALAMVLSRVRSAVSSGNLNSYSYLLDRSSTTTEVQDAERLMEELQWGLQALRTSIQADAVFGGVGMMAKKVDEICKATAMD